VAELHAPRQAPQDRGALVAREVVPRARAHHVEDALEGGLAVLVDRCTGPGRMDERRELVLVARELRQACGELSHRQHDVRDLGRDHGAGHGLVQRLARVLHQDEAAGVLHGARAEHAVGAAARQDHGEAVAVALGSERRTGRSPCAARAAARSALRRSSCR
jgi:hypothetical protein